jgi:hypothetical protein
VRVRTKRIVYVSLSYENMQVKVLKKAGDEFRIKNDYEIKTR